MGEEAARPPGAPSGGGGGREAPAGARPTPPGPWAPGRRPTPAEGWAAPLRCCPPACRSLGTGSPGRGARAGGGGAIPAGVSLGRLGPSSQPTLSKLLRLGETLRLCSSAAASRTPSSLALTMSRSWPWLATRKGHVRRGDGALGPGGGGRIPPAAKKRQATPASGVASLHLPQPSCAPARAHTPTHTRGVPLGRTQLQKRGGAKPPARSASVCSGSDDFRAVFCKLILLVSAQSEFNHGSKSDRMASFPSGFGHAASGRSLAEPTGREKYLAALRGASRPPSLAPGAGLCCRSEAWELGARGRWELRAGAQSGLPRAASSAQGCSPEENLAGEGAKGGGLGARTLHTPARWRQTGYGWGWGKSCAQRPQPTGPSSGSRYAKAASPVASGLRAARGAPGRSGSLPVARRGRGSPRGPRPSAFPPRYSTAPTRFQTPGGRRGAGTGHSPGRCELR